MSKDDAKIMAALEKMGIKKLSKEDANSVREFFSTRSLNTGLSELEVFYYINKSLLKTYGSVSIQNMMRIYKETDFEMILQFFAEFYDLKSKSLDEKEFMKEFRKFVKKIYYRNTETTKKIKSVVEEELSKLETVKNALYLGIGNEKVADQLFDNCTKRSKLFLDMCDADNLADLVLYLKNNIKLSNNELLDISSRCATFFANSSTKKIMELKSTLESLKRYIKKNLTVADKESNVNKSFKDIILNTPSFFVSNYEVVNNTVKFLQGASLGELMENIPDELLDFKADFNAEDILDIFDNSITSLSISVDKIASVSINVSKVYKSVFGQELPLQGLINSNNFNSITQLTNEDFDINGKIKEVFNLLKPFLDAEGMEILLKKDFSFLIASSEEVKNSLKDAIFNSKNPEEVKYNVMKKIKNHFDHYESGYYVPSNSVKKHKNKKRKTQIKEINREDIELFLTTIDASEAEIKEWQEKWNEEREYKQLEVEYELENILEGIHYLESEALNIRFNDVADIDAQGDVFNSMLEDAILKKEEALFRCVANQEIQDVNEKIDLAVKKVRDNFDFKVDEFLEEFKDRIKLLNTNINDLNIAKNDIDAKITKNEEMKNILVEQGINAESLVSEKENIEALEDVLEIYRKENERADIFYKKAMAVITNFDETFVKNSDLFNTQFQSGFSRFNDPGYVLYMLTHILVKDGYMHKSIIEDIALKIEEEDINMSIDNLKTKLSPKQQTLVEEIYSSFKTCDDISSNAFAELLEAAVLFGVDYTSTNTYEGVERLVKRKIRSMIAEHNNRKDLLTRQEKYEKSIDIKKMEDIKMEVEKLNESIGEILLTIENVETKKMNQRK